jgi:hypothetical protein
VLGQSKFEILGRKMKEMSEIAEDFHYSTDKLE